MLMALSHDDLRPNSILASVQSLLAAINLTVSKQLRQPGYWLENKENLVNGELLIGKLIAPMPATRDEDVCFNSDMIAIFFQIYDFHVIAAALR